MRGEKGWISNTDRPFEMAGYGCDDMGIKKHKEKNVMDKKLVRKAMGESDISQGIGNGRQHGQQKEERRKEKS